MIAAFFVLRSQITLKLAQLRIIELVVFGALVVQIGLMTWRSLIQYAAADDYATVVGVKNLYLAAFCVIIFIYGMLMPNTWRRAAAILLPVAAIPYVLIYASQLSSEKVVQALQADHFATVVPLTLVAAFAAVYGTHVVNSIRREAFKARQFGQYRLKDKLVLAVWERFIGPSTCCSRDPVPSSSSSQARKPMQGPWHTLSERCGPLQD